MRIFTAAVLLLFCTKTYSQQADYLKELKQVGREFANYFYPNYDKIYSLPEKKFTYKIDSARNKFIGVLGKYQLSEDFVKEQQIEIKYYFDKLLIDYRDSYIIPKRLQGNIADFNKPELLSNSDFTNYVKAFLSYKARGLKDNNDNQQLNIAWKLIKQYFSNTTCRDFWQTEYLRDHIENNGIKNIDKIYKEYNYKDSTVRALYTEDSTGRQGHLIKTYKLNLDIHIFQPDTFGDKKRPVIVFFHGGSWSEGKPDWFFPACQAYAQKGWVACAVEYRTFGRHGTLPFKAVMDARSAIRWLRQHAKEFNIDTNKIIASGNSAGGHLALCTVLAEKWNEHTDDVKFSPVPNALMINSGVYDLTDKNTTWIKKGLKNKDLVKEISPVYLVKKDFPPTLIIHGTNDQNVPYPSAKKFVDEMKETGNNTIEFITLENAGHFIWIDDHYSPQVAEYRRRFVEKLNF